MNTTTRRPTLMIGFAMFALFAASRARAAECGAESSLEGDWVLSGAPLHYSTALGAYDVAGVRIGHRCVEAQECYDSADGQTICTPQGTQLVYTVSVGTESSIEVFPPILDYSRPANVRVIYSENLPWLVADVLMNGEYLRVYLSYGGAFVDINTGNVLESEHLQGAFEQFITDRSQGVVRSRLVRRGRPIRDIGRLSIHG